MAVTITTTTTDPAPTYDGVGGNANWPGSGRRKIATTATGQVWAVVCNGASSRTEFWYSDDNGAAWAENTDLRLSGTHIDAAIHINTVSGHMAVALAGGTWGFSGTGGVFQGVSLNVSATSTWSNIRSTSYGTPRDYTTGWINQGGLNYFTSCDCVTFAKPGSSNFYHATVAGMVSNESPPLSMTWLYIAEFDSAGLLVTGSGSYGSAYGTSNLASPYTDGGTAVTIDFRHTGDGSTIASSSPDVFVAMVDTNTNITFRKLPWNGSGWDAGTARNLLGSAVNITYLSGIFDGTRFLVAYASGTSAKLVDRDAGDTTTGTYGTPTANDETIDSISVDYDGYGDVRIFAGGATSKDVELLVYDRSAGTWGTWSTVHSGSTDVNARSLSVQRGRYGPYLHLIWLEGTSTPWNVNTTSSLFNQPPNASTWDIADGPGDINESLVLPWTFSDPDEGDAQASYALRKRVDGGSYSYWNGSSWVGTEQQNTSTTESVTLASSWASDEEEVEFWVKTWDDYGGLEGVYSDPLTITASVQVNPTLTVPAGSATITAPTGYEVTWTCSEQSAYKVRILTSGDVELYSTGWVTSTDKTIYPAYSLDNGLTGLKFEVTTKNTQGLASDADTNTGIDVTWTPPATPTYTITANDAAGYISVVIADPTPAGAQPDVLYHDIYVRVASGGTQVGERTVNDSGIRISTGEVGEDGTYLDYAASGVDFEYRTLAVGDNGGTVYGAWT